MNCFGGGSGAAAGAAAASTGAASPAALTLTMRLAPALPLPLLLQLLPAGCHAPRLGASPAPMRRCSGHQAAAGCAPARACQAGAVLLQRARATLQPLDSILLNMAQQSGELSDHCVAC